MTWSGNSAHSPGTLLGCAIWPAELNAATRRLYVAIDQLPADDLPGRLVTVTVGLMGIERYIHDSARVAWKPGATFGPVG